MREQPAQHLAARPRWRGAAQPRAEPSRGCPLRGAAPRSPQSPGWREPGGRFCGENPLPAGWAWRKARKTQTYPVRERRRGLEHPRGSEGNFPCPAPQALPFPRSAVTKPARPRQPRATWPLQTRARSGLLPAPRLPGAGKPSPRCPTGLLRPLISRRRVLRGGGSPRGSALAAPLHSGHFAPSPVMGAAGPRGSKQGGEFSSAKK